MKLALYFKNTWFILENTVANLKSQKGMKAGLRNPRKKNPNCDSFVEARSVPGLFVIIRAIAQQMPFSEGSLPCPAAVALSASVT
jgi:hypothetical protein